MVVHSNHRGWCWLLSALLCVCATDAAAGGAASSSSPLLPRQWVPLPYGRVTPEGWLQRELRLQADGLSGTFFTRYWEPIVQSEWLGGNSTYEDYVEIFPYVFQGFARQAILLNDTAQLAVVERWINTILASATADGWFGPLKSQPAGMIYWPRWPVVLTFLAWYEYGGVVNGTGDARVLDVSLKWMHAAYGNMTTNFPLSPSWSGYRWQDFLLVAQALLDCAATPSSERPFLGQAMGEIYKQGSGIIDWERNWFVPGKFPTTSVPHWNILPHGVNNAMAVKSGALVGRAGFNKGGFASSYERLRLLDRYHGAPAGHFQADECLAGNMPSRGAETCLVVEEMFSLSVIHEVQGDAYFKDREERIAYNSLPGALTKDMWARVYLQQANELLAAPTNPHVWVSDGPDSTVFSLADNFACCTANFNQGWPRHIQHMVHTAGKAGGGIAISSFAPLSAVFPGLGANHTDLHLRMTGDYPFDDDVSIQLSGLPAGVPVKLPVHIRIPAWATAATLLVNGAAPVRVGQHNGTMMLVQWPAGTVGPSVRFILATNPAIRVEHYYNNSVAVYRGALLYALQLGEHMKVVKSYPGGARDYNITLDAQSSPWNVALVADQNNLTARLRFHRHSASPPTVPFSSGQSPVSITAPVRQLHSWPIVDNAAGPPPRSPVTCSSAPSSSSSSSSAMLCSPVFQATLVPFGTTHLRIAEMPFTYG